MVLAQRGKKRLEHRNSALVTLAQRGKRPPKQTLQRIVLPPQILQFQLVTVNLDWLFTFVSTYRPQPSTSPLYDFCELQTLMLRNLDRVPLRDVDLRCPDGPLAKRLRQRFYEMLQCNVKLGKRTLSEFRADESTSTYYLHVLVSSDAQRMTLRAKLLYDPVYLRVPVVEDGKVCPWNKPAFAEICEAIQHASV